MLNGIECPGIAALAALSGLIVNIGLNFFLIPHYGALGAVMATILSFLVITLVAYFICVVNYFCIFRGFRWRLFWRLSVEPVSVLVVSVVSGTGWQLSFISRDCIRSYRRVNTLFSIYVVEEKLNLSVTGL